ncbi:aspartyl/asparaginyl beta-hydroxylase isoform X2 [Condylostylus longicornis]|uniref:aspartyl/asparaginyl beta-hydroxylase isoform X2 n=1 Tax=Condylostylus longicornis TaxID=2530218 RepID=UPI00244DAF1A|nr:aspartyl/asparaginyl beta-hydroxylase isoform X2 [Condylostylus longicornis]
MSGDVQPRKRKDKKRKREEDEGIHHGVHATKMGTDDVHLHVQSDHGTGGHWCAKIFFFSLLAILVGLIGLIIMENRGLADLDTPLSESRYSEYFEGWVDEHRESHDHDPHEVVAHEIEEHEEHDEPFEEEEDVSEPEEELVEHEEDDEHDDEDHDDDTADVEEDEEEADEDEDEGTAENEDEEKDNVTQEDVVTKENQEDEEDEEESKPIFTRVRRAVPSQEAEVSIEGKAIEETKETDVDEQEEDGNDENEPFEEEDDDTTFEVVDNDAEEIKILQEKARKIQEETDDVEPEVEEESYVSPLAVKILVGFALAIVARVVLIKNGNVDDKAKSKAPEDDLPEDVLMKRRLTVASPEMLEDDEIVEELEEEVIEEEIEEEVEEIDEVEEVDEPEEKKTSYRPETFEELNAMFKPKAEPIIAESFASKDKIKDAVKEDVERKSVQSTSQNETRKQTEADKGVSLPNVKKEHSTNYEDKFDEGEEEHGVGEALDEEEAYEEELGSEEEELSEVDDDDLMERLEQKYGKLPDRSEVYDSEEENIEIDKSWTKIKPRSGGGPQAFETEDEYIEEQLRRANQHMLQDNIDNALKIYESLILKNPDSYGAFLGKAVALDKLSEQQKSNSKLKDAIFAYKKYLAFGDDIKDDVTYRKTAERCIERMRFLGLVSQAVAIHENLINRFQNDLKLQNELAVTYLLNNQLREAKIVLHNTLMKWPNDGFAKVHYGFVLKNLDRDLENAVNYLKDGINSNQNGTQDGRFYFNLGEALQRLNRSDEAMEVFRKGAKRKLFPSEYQRSLYNVNNLRAKPFWLKKEFPNDYQDFFSMLERNWRQIREEGINALNEKKYFIDEAENLKDKGDWKQFELYAQGIKKIKNCEKARVTCALIETFPPARYCRRGQTKFSIMDEGTHVWPHCGPTNCRLRAHLGLKVPSGTKIRVAKDLKTWEEGKFLIFDDSFEHEVWHNGTSPRLVLIVDIWHPDLSESERKSLSPI